jgi:oligopeptide transport system substrate-binding protein
MKGVEDYFKGKITDFDQVGVKALDDHTLQIELVSPTPYLLSLLQYPAWFPVNPKTILKFGTISTRDTKWILPENFVGNGPFKLKSWKSNDVIEMVRNPLYWDAATVKLNGINFYFIENQSTEDRAFQAGQLHRTCWVQLDKIPYYQLKRPEYLRIDPWKAVYLYRLNVERKPLDNPKVRLALNLAVNREAIVKNITRQNEQPATGFVPPGMGNYYALKVITHNPDKARQLLAEAGYPGGKGFPTFTILINMGEAPRVIAEAIQQMWKEELSINVKIESQEWKVCLDTQEHMNYDIARSGRIGDFMDPVTFLDIWTTGNRNNKTHWGDPKYDELIHRAARTRDAKVRLNTLRQAEELFLSKPPVILIYWYTRAYLIQPSVKNWNPLSLDNHNYKFIDLELTGTASEK